MTPQYLPFEFESQYYPLDEKIILNSKIAVFESQAASCQYDLPEIRFLSQLPELNVYYGAASTKVYPFICFPETPLSSLPTSHMVLGLLKASCFKSEHIQDLDIVSVPFPGYHAYTENDEIHADANKQHLFAQDLETLSEDELEDLEEEGTEEYEASQRFHHSLRNFVMNKHLYYALVHDKTKTSENLLGGYVVLFAVGVAPKTGNLIGVVSHQVCHNLCD